MSRDTCNQNDPENCPGDCSECSRDPDARRDREDERADWQLQQQEDQELYGDNESGRHHGY